MKKFHLFVSSLLFCFASFAQETWTVDNSHSNIRFEVGWEDFSFRTGEFKVFESNLITNSKDDLSHATFHFKVDPKSVDVIAERLSEQLRGERFLDAEKFPEITYNSSEAEAISDSTYISKGKLTIHGVEKDQDVHIWVKGHKTGRRGYIFGLEVSLTLNRKDFGLDWGSPRLGETIKVIGHLLYQMKIEEE
ncbi:MAG: YceI family protein [Bacteroidetes bacterium]|nr:YceI family protein [Bacteroidota bacterium]